MQCFEMEYGLIIKALWIHIEGKKTKFSAHPVDKFFLHLQERKRAYYFLWFYVLLKRWNCIILQKITHPNSKTCTSTFAYQEVRVYQFFVNFALHNVITGKHERRSCSPFKTVFKFYFSSLVPFLPS